MLSNSRLDKFIVSAPWARGEVESPLSLYYIFILIKHATWKYKIKKYYLY